MNNFFGKFSWFAMRCNVYDGSGNYVKRLGFQSSRLSSSKDSEMADQAIHRFDISGVR